jgi:hypothetical protein
LRFTATVFLASVTASRAVEKTLGVTPWVFSRIFNPNEQVNRVDFGQTTVNLGHHLENITNNP